MSDVYEVLAIRYGHHKRNASENFIGGDPHDLPMPLDYFVWVIRNEQRTIVVDTGFGAESGARRKRELVRPVAEGLQAAGVDVGKVKDVIITHMHYDHAGNNHLFPSASFHLQDSEMAFATGRCMCHPLGNHPYDVDAVAGLVYKVYAGNVVFHDGDEELFPGISLHHIGGHARGLQCVRVKTQRGPVVLASDASHHYAHMEEDRVFPSCDSVSDALEGYNKLRRLGGSSQFIIPGHDPQVMKNYPAYSEATDGWIAKLDSLKTG